MYAQGLTRLSPPVRRLSSRIYRPRALHSTSKRWQGDARNVRPSNSATSALSAEAVDALWQTARKKLAEVPKVPSPSSIAGALLLIPVAGGAWFVTVYALRQRLCEHRLQQVDGVGISHPSGGRRKRHTRHNGGNGRDANETAPLRPGSTADARALREILSTPAKGVTVLCLDPPASYTGEAFLSSALSGRAATVHIRAGEGDGALVACLARGLGIPFVIAKLQISWMLSGLGLAGREGSGVPATGSNAQEMKDLAAVLETATAALEEIRGQAVDPRNHLPPVIVLDGILGHVREGEDIPAPVEAVLRWCWTITGGRRLAHVVLTAPQSMAVDGSLVRVREFLNDGRLSPSMVHVVGLNAPDGGVTEKRFRACLSSCTTARNRYGPRDSTDQEGEVTGEGENERAVKLAMELIEGEDFGVAEEANEVLRRIRASSSFSPGKKTALSVSSSVGRALGGIAFEAWRRVSAAVTETNSHAIPYALLDDPPLALGWESNAMRSVSKTVEGERNAKPVPSTRRASVGIPPSNSGDFHLRGLHGRAAMDSRRGFVVDDYSPLEMSDFASLQDSAPDGEVETDYSGALLSPESEDDSNVSVGGAYAPASPLDELLGLMGALADGSSLTVTDAVARLGGDGQRLARLLDLGVLRLRPRTAFSMSSLAPEDSERALGTEAARGAWARVGGRVRSFSLVLPEADVAFEVRSATPLIEGIFSILKGCGAGTEERVLGAVTALVGSASGGSFPKPEQASSEQLEAFQASREAFMGGLIERALAAYGDGRNGSDEETGIVLPTRRLQAILAAAGCIVTRKEIEEDMIAGGSQVSRGSTITMPTATTARAALVRRLLRLPLELSPEHPRPPPDAADAAGAADVDVDTAVPSNQEGEGTPENDVGVGDTGAGSVGDAERDRGPADKLSSVAEGKYVEDGDPSRGGGGGGLGSGHERPLGVKSGSGPVEPPSRSAQSVPHHESEDGVREATDDSRSCTTQSSSQGQVDVDVDVDFDVDVGIDADLNKVGVDGDADVVAEVGIEGRDGEDGEDQLKKSGPPVQDVEHTDVGEPKGASVSRRDELGRSQGNDVHHDAEEAMSMLPDTGGTASGEASGVNDVTNMRRTKADEHDGDGGESHEAGGASYAGDHGADLSHGGADDRDARVDTEVDGGGDDQSKGGIVGENIAPEEKEDTGKGSQEGEAPPVKGNGRRWPWRWSISTWGGGTKS